MHAKSTFVCLALLLVSVPIRTGAQVVGRLASPDGLPVRGALLTLVDGNGKPVGSAVSDSAGRFSLPGVTTPTLSLRVERVGFAATERQHIPIDTAAIVTLNLEVQSSRVALQDVRSATFACEPGAPTGAAADVWEQASLGLRLIAAVEARAAQPLRGMRYLRILDPSAVIHRATIEQQPFSGHRAPYSVPVGDTLPSAGFRAADSLGTATLYLPSPSVLLSPGFLALHCFDRLLRAEDGRVGLGFRPMRADSAVLIEGVMWLEPATAALRSVEFVYQDPTRQLAQETRGLMAFGVGAAQLPQVSRWWLRTPARFESERGADSADNTLEAGGFVFAGDAPIDDAEGVFGRLTGVIQLAPIEVQAERDRYRTPDDAFIQRIPLAVIRGAPTTDAFDVVQSLHPLWLFRRGGCPAVYLDAMLLTAGGCSRGLNDVFGHRPGLTEDALRGIPAAWIGAIDYYDPMTSIIVFGNGNGTIVVRSLRR